MNKDQYIKRIKAHEAKFDKLWVKIVVDTNKFIKDNPDIEMDSLGKPISNFVGNLCLSGAWIEDMINKKIGIPSSRTYRGSLSKKIRKTLGYTY